MLDKYNWIINDIDDKKAALLSVAANLSAGACKILINRGIKDQDQVCKFLSKNILDLEDPFGLKDLKEAASIIIEAVSEKKKILIFGDYDVDGVSATALLYKALQLLGSSPLYYIPHRVEEGYGLSADGIEFAEKKGTDLIITVDNGINSHEEVNLIKKKGMDLIITDHHLAGKTLPDARAVINPKRGDCNYPNKELSGSGVAFKLVQGIFKTLNKALPEELICLAALGTLSDSVILTPENKIIASIGLDLINKKKHAGINELLSAASFRKKIIDSFCILFVICPRLNASGRLEKADEALKLLLENDKKNIQKLAEGLNKLNQRRQDIENSILKEINIKLCKSPSLLENNAIILKEESWHLGVLGIISSRLCEKYNKPAFLLAQAGGILKGSVRVPDGYDACKMLESAENTLIRFGGHKKAAGFSISKENFSEFENTIQCQAEKIPKQKPALNIDAELRLNDINLKFADDIKMLEPFGPGNEEPIFLLRKVNLKDIRLVGNPPVHLKLVVEKDKSSLSAIGFKKEEYYTHLDPENFYHDIVFTVRAENYMDTKSVSLHIKDIKLPQKECLHILTGSDKIQAKSSSNNSLPLILDARYLKDKERYISSALKFNPSYLILIKTNEKAEKIKKILKDPLKIIHSEIYWRNIYDKDSSTDDILFYDPPIDVEKFKHFKTSSRIHLLFDQDDIQRLENNIKLSCPSRQILALIYKTIVNNFKQFGKKTYKKSNLAELINHPLVAESTLNTALIIFQELDILEVIYLQDEIILIPKADKKKNLQESINFVEAVSLIEKFKETKKIINHPKLNLLKEIMK